MSFSVEYRKKTECIYVSIIGELNLDLFQEMSAEVGLCIKKYKCNKILNDLRKAILTDSAGDVYFMPKQALGAGIVRSIRRALLVDGDFSEYRFLETVFVNQGNVVQLFNDIDDAKEWLFGGRESSESCS